MTAKTTILHTTSFDDFASLFRFLRSDTMRRYLSRGQVESIADICDARLPADVTLEQRTIKGTTYVYVDGDFLATVNQAGAVKYPKPRFIYDLSNPGKHLEQTP